MVASYVANADGWPPSRCRVAAMGKSSGSRRHSDGEHAVVVDGVAAQAPSRRKPLCSKWVLTGCERRMRLCRSWHARAGWAGRVCLYDDYVRMWWWSGRRLADGMGWEEQNGERSGDGGNV